MLISYVFVAVVCGSGACGKLCHQLTLHLEGVGMLFFFLCDCCFLNQIFQILERDLLARRSDNSDCA